MDDERKPITALEEFDAIDARDCRYGYLAGSNGAPEPSIEMNRSYWHGWRNGMVDSGRMPKDAAQALLAKVVVASKRLQNLEVK